jgi:hypothetical protein
MDIDVIYAKSKRSRIESCSMSPIITAQFTKSGLVRQYSLTNLQDYHDLHVKITCLIDSCYVIEKSREIVEVVVLIVQKQPH